MSDQAFVTGIGGASKGETKDAPGAQLSPQAFEHQFETMEALGRTPAAFWSLFGPEESRTVLVRQHWLNSAGHIPWSSSPHLSHPQSLRFV